MAESIKDFDIRTVKKESLPQINDIVIDETQSPEERAVSFLKQLGGRYCYADEDMIISFSYVDTDVNLSNKLAMYASSLG